jgi:hypothetical protein
MSASAIESDAVVGSILWLWEPWMWRCYVDVEGTNAVTFMRSSEKLGPLPSARRGWSLPDQPRVTSGNVTHHR